MDSRRYTTHGIGDHIRLISQIPELSQYSGYEYLLVTAVVPDLDNGDPIIITEVRFFGVTFFLLY